jgi:putative protease
LCDLSLANHISELIESGVSSLKIEGRMKSPEYVYTVTSIYRRLLDENRSASVKETDELRRVFSRGGFTDGYFSGKKIGRMTGVRSDEDKRLTKEVSEMKFEPIRKKVFAKVIMKLGEPSVMTLYNQEKSVTVTGGIPKAAINAPLEREAVLNRLSKMGATLLTLSPEDIELVLDEEINLPPSEINALRRDAAERFEDPSRLPVEIKSCLPSKTSTAHKKLVTAHFFSSKAYLEYKNGEHRDFFDISFLPIEDFNGAEGVSIPPVIFDSELEGVKKMLASAKEKGARAVTAQDIAERIRIG